MLGSGANAGITSRFMQWLRDGLAGRGHTTTIFEFDYQTAGRTRPDATPALEARVRAVAAEAAAGGRRAFVLGGKSMGGRMASRVLAVDDARPAGVRGLVFYGYPLHPAGRVEKLRVEHLPAVPVPMLFVSGTRDPLCRLDLLTEHVVPLPLATVHLVEDGDHSLRVPARAVRSQAEVDAEILDVTVAWARALPAPGAVRPGGA